MNPLSPIVAAVVSADLPTAESFNIWVILASTLIPYVLKRVFPKLPLPPLGPSPIVPVPQPQPAPQPVPAPIVPQPTPLPPGTIDPLALVWMLLKKVFPNLPDLAPGEALTEEHIAAVAAAELKVDKK